MCTCISRCLHPSHWQLSKYTAVFTLSLLLALTTACSTKKPDYTKFREHYPRSILVLPPANATSDIEAPSQYLSTVSTALAECGYYVFPIAIVHQMLIENGLPTADEMHSVPLSKLYEVFGADAVLYVRITHWGTQYLVLSSESRVTLEYRLIDATSGAEIWSRTQTIHDNSGNNSGDLLTLAVGAAVHALSNRLSDKEYHLAKQANHLAFTRGYRLLKGPHHPGYREDRHPTAAER